MANRFDISLLGDKALADTFAGLTEALEKKVLTRALKEATVFFQKTLSPRLPRSSPRRRTGSHLADTLRVVQLRRKKGRVGYRVTSGTREQLGIVPKDKHFYPAVLEFGTKTRPPHPVWRSALQQDRETLLAIVRQGVDAGIERELKKAGG